MTPPTPSRQPTGDEVQMKLLLASFQAAHEEVGRRSRGAAAPEADGGGALSEGDGAAGEAARLEAALRRHLGSLEPAALEELHLKLARGVLRSIDRRIAGAGDLPGERPDVDRLAVEPAAPTAGSTRARVGLVSLPWMSPAMPSIQLATLASALDREGIASDVHELYVDYAARIGLNLHNHLGNLLGPFPEWVFSRHYYGPEHGDDLSAMLDQHPLEDFPWKDFESVIPHALDPVTADFLDHLMEDVDWSSYDVVGCTLTLSQLGASMAFARRLKLRHPAVQVIFGGSQCAGPMGRAVLRICPFVDVVVHIEGELVLPELVRRLQDGGSPEGLPGVSFRRPADDGGGAELVSAPPGELYRPDGEKLPLDYDPYFRRLIHLGVLEKMNPWLPFESSRGCWYGQKSQCTFCGLHEIMEFRAWDGDLVLAELERLRERYGIGRFYSMDLILPREYFRTLFPEVVGRGHDWMFFYEVKANMRREEVELLAASGVRWIQPGIESLDTEVLRLMKKGVSAAQNVLLLKWCEEVGIFCAWNILHGLPGERAESYERMERLIPKITHLRPPNGGGHFQLHRFSPYFEHPEAFAIRPTGAHHMFQYAFPVPEEELDELVYLHDFTLEPGAPEPVDVSRLKDVVAEWRRAYRRGASLQYVEGSDGTGLIEDRRRIGSPPRKHRLSEPEAALYRFLDAGTGERAAAERFQRAHPEAAQALEAEPGGVAAVLERWLRDDLVLAADGQVVSLAVRTKTLQPERTRVRQLVPKWAAETELAGDSSFTTST